MTTEQEAIEELRRVRVAVSDWLSTMRDLMAQHEEFDGQAIHLIDETGLHFPLADEVDDLRARVFPPATNGGRNDA